MDTFNSHYTILNITEEATSDEIKIAYRRMSMRYHPDRNGSIDTTEFFQKVNQAYQTLSDEALRKQYDLSQTSPQQYTPKTTAQNQQQTHWAPPEVVEPVALKVSVCCVCGKIPTQPRYVIYNFVFSLVLFTIRRHSQGVFCSTCAKKKMLKSTLFTWLFGFWSFPWGIIYSIETLLNNLKGGQQPFYTNAYLGLQQAYYFSGICRHNLARAVALDLHLRLKRHKPKNKTEDFQHQEIQTMVEELLSDLPKQDPLIILKKAWRLGFVRFMVQLIPLLGLACLILFGFYFLYEKIHPYG